MVQKNECMIVIHYGIDSKSFIHWHVIKKMSRYYLQ